MARVCVWLLVAFMMMVGAGHATEPTDTPQKSGAQIQAETYRTRVAPRLISEVADRICDDDGVAGTSDLELVNCPAPLGLFDYELMWALNMARSDRGAGALAAPYVAVAFQSSAFELDAAAFDRTAVAATVGIGDEASVGVLGLRGGLETGMVVGRIDSSDIPSGTYGGFIAGAETWVTLKPATALPVAGGVVAEVEGQMAWFGGDEGRESHRALFEVRAKASLGVQVTIPFGKAALELRVSTPLIEGSLNTQASYLSSVAGTGIGLELVLRPFWEAPEPWERRRVGR